MARNRFLVKRVEGRWSVKEVGSTRLLGQFVTKPHALAEARRAAERHRPSEVVVEGSDGIFEFDQRLA